jgi:flagellin-like protein
MNRKGISPILAAVLLFAVTVSIVGIFANFAPNLIGTVTSGTEQQASNQIKCEGAGISFEGINYDTDGTPENVTVNVRNTGESELNNLTVAVFNENNEVLNQTQDVTAEVQGITGKTVRLDDGGTPGYVQAFSGQCGSIEIRQEIQT